MFSRKGIEVVVDTILVIQNIIFFTKCVIFYYFELIKNFFLILKMYDTKNKIENLFLYLSSYCILRSINKSIPINFLTRF